MIKKLIFISIPLIAFALPRPSQAEGGPIICDIVWDEDVGPKASDDDGEERCPTGRPAPLGPPPPPCVPVPGTFLCSLDP